ncbi:UDP-3-O-[3-hydroxymyristoyl] glucosamine N-acyltransferase [Candidatus Scalindua japonica]|uniref:UDP-3-O-acylglucosamine N-acyltransferase n=1 Tax=Candidatus Scalindua japonica TaxID=1284222 RepID=A0A286TUH3_9BACT|nr:UDP-3-O-(3-hydroxymyristoyl)glucosamine N-acyltransferase [Candidatus Scalindua japonica]GAX59528.1 UDP-3-O-[3-hydroxymyristoyl] glucosamine N-acyltransferase [Candidatus Scalindua japonica]
MKYTIKQISEIIGGKVLGDGNLIVTGVSSIENAEKGDISFIKNERLVSKVLQTNASAVVSHRLIEESKKTFIITDNPFLAFIKLLKVISDNKQQRPRGIHESAVISNESSVGDNISIGTNVVIEGNTQIGKNVIIYPNVFIGTNCKIGDDSIIYPNVTIREEVTIGDRVVIQSGASIGDDGFGYLQIKGKHVKIPQVGTIEIGNDVSIGSHVTIARAALDKTIISSGVKIDNHSHIAHNCIIGEDSMLIAYAKLAGGVKIGKNVIIAEDVGITDHVEIGDKCMVGAASNVYKSIKPGSVIWGSPAKPITFEKRLQVLIKKLPDIYRKVKGL